LPKTCETRVAQRLWQSTAKGVHILNRFEKRDVTKACYQQYLAQQSTNPAG